MAKKITDAEWLEIMRLHIVEGVGSRALYEQFGVSESTIRSRAKTAQIAQVKRMAKQIVTINEEFVQMDGFAQSLTSTLACKLNTISTISADVAESEAVSAKKLSAFKSVQILNLDPENVDLPTVALIKVLGEAINDSLKTAFSLLNANKNFIEDQNKALEKPTQKYTRIERVIVNAEN